ncbi:ABC transporter ATP-binding protein [Bulleidia sp. zg-1006]|uniref:ABC transporter ATP-binding protein n=1 Tax=Bulleidia sp. zg-1006 TaxID=2806552 RepID=UPI00193A5968|nr:ABC transporter ATP-binding protein [Bulleidia sp. zg-1006]QRG87301.1 ABC transporter ATP-binding protein [Bulleidia sp. zg-1006]
MKMIELKGVKKTYIMGEVQIPALAGVDFSIDEGQVAAIVGNSGAGKSTILNILGGMDYVTSGEVYIRGQAIHKMNEKDLTNYRRLQVGFVFQFYNLVGNLTALENIELASEISNHPLKPEEILDLVGLKDRKAHFPAQLSGGEQQRVAIARAIVKNPDLLLCDEPTGALDDKTGKQILQLLQDMSRQFHKTVIIITHNQAICPMADVVIRVKDGLIQSYTENKHPLAVEEIEW